jgi:hypothetical protein
VTDKVWVVIGTLPYESGAYLLGVFTDEFEANGAEVEANKADKWVHYTVIERTLNTIEEGLV